MELTKDLDFLRQVSKPVGLKKGMELGREMLAFIERYNRTHKRQAIGLAAPQVGVLSQVCVLSFSTTSKMILVNPSIVSHSDYQLKSREGCLSFPAYKVVDLYRWLWVEVFADNLSKPQPFGPLMNVPSGYPSFLCSAAVQHELQHLQGILITDECNQKDLSCTTK